MSALRTYPGVLEEERTGGTAQPLPRVPEPGEFNRNSGFGSEMTELEHPTNTWLLRGDFLPAALLDAFSWCSRFQATAGPVAPT